MGPYSHVIPALEKETANRLDTFFQKRGSANHSASQYRSSLPKLVVLWGVDP